MNTYYIAGFPVSDELYHYGIKGQSWGRRRFQNLDGSLTVLGRQHYDVGAPLDPNGQPSQYQYRLPPQAQLQTQAQSSSQSRYTQQQIAQIQAQQMAQRQRMQSAVEVNDKASVTNAQRNLQNLGYDLKRYGADGKVGDETRSAINAFKRDHGLQQDGKLDLATSKMMEAESKSSLKKGAKGENVTRMQDTLKSLGYKLDKYGSDGKFGNETQQALNEFKKAHGLPENGIYDGATRTAMAQELAKKNAPVVPQTQVQPITTPVQQQTTTQTTNTQVTEPSQDSQIQPEAQSTQPGTSQVNDDAASATEQDKEKKIENERTKQSGKKKAEQILDSISKSGNQIAEQHKTLSTAISKAAGKTGDALSDAARKVSSAHGSLVSSISSAADSIKDAAERRAKMYDSILETSRTVSTATLQIQKDVQRASDQLVKQHNKLVSELNGLSRDARKAVKKTSKQAKKTGRSISSFFNSARTTLDRGSNALASWFGI